MGVADYMTRCLHDPSFGYYATRPALGEDGDFITAPLVSQMFGELIGLWAVETWRRLGAPKRLLLVEVGPGDGTLISDALRAAGLAPDFLAAAELWLVETSAPLMADRRAALADAALAPRWIDSLADLPSDAPVVLIANELFDCLPARQLVRTPAGWAERQIGLDENGNLAFGLASLQGHRGDAGQQLGARSPKSLRGATGLPGPGVRGPGSRQERGAALVYQTNGRDEPGTGDACTSRR